MPTPQADTNNADFVRWIIIACAPFVLAGMANGSYLGHLFAIHPALFWLADILHFVVLTAFAVYVLSAKLQLHPRDYGFVAPDPKYHWVQFALLVLIVFMWTGFLFVLAKYISLRLLPHGGAGFSYADALAASGAWRVLALMYFSLSAGLGEEIIYRALPLLVFKRLFAAPTLPYVFFTAPMFGMIHWEGGLAAVATAFVLGLAFAWIYAKLRNIWPLIIAHTMIDYLAFR